MRRRRDGIEGLESGKEPIVDETVPDSPRQATDATVNIDASTKSVTGVPQPADEEAKTLSEAPHHDRVGGETEELSDITDEQDAEQATSTRNAFLTLNSVYRQIQPLIRSSQVRGLAYANFIFACINVLFLAMLVVAVALLGRRLVEINRMESIDRPCHLRWGPWSTCSATCRSFNSSNPPFKTRAILADRVIQASGRYALTSPCPNLKDLTDTSPCNTWLCPQNLTDFPWAESCFFNNLDEDGLGIETSGCYMIRNITPGDRLVGAVDMII